MDERNVKTVKLTAQVVLVLTQGKFVFLKIVCTVVYFVRNSIKMSSEKYHELNIIYRLLMAPKVFAF